MPYFVHWVREGKISRFAFEHPDIESAMEFACEALRIECSDVWINDENGQRIADRIAIARYADKTGKPYN